MANTRISWGVTLLLLMLLSPAQVRAQTSPPTAQSQEMKDAYVTVNGLKLHYVVQGTGHIILFLHGFPEFWYAWKNQLQEFGKTNEAIAVDMPGYNLSDKPPKVQDYAMLALVADLKAFIAAIAPDSKVTLVGHDWGGAVAWVYAAYYPDTLDKLVIINAPHPTLFLHEMQTNPTQQMESAMMYRVRDHRAEGVLSQKHYSALDSYLFGSAASPASFSEADRKAYHDAWAQPGALTGALNYFRSADIGAQTTKNKDKSKSPEIALPVITVPTLVIWGEKDPGLVLGNLDGLDALVTHLTVLRVPTAGHWIVHDQPGTVNNAIQTFLAPASP